MSELLEAILIITIPVLGAGTLIGIFCRMKPGFGPFNLRAVGIVFIGTLASLLALLDQNALNAAMALLGAIAGYLFGIGRDQDSSKRQDT